MSFRRVISFLFVFGLFVTAAVPAFGADRATADFVVVGVDEVIVEDLYAVGNSVDVRGTIDGDLIADLSEPLQDRSLLHRVGQPGHHDVGHQIDPSSVASAALATCSS